MSTEKLERKINEIHEYARHLFGLLVTWFVFFATVNYATMGWLTKPESSSAPHGGAGQERFLYVVVSVLFLIQNLIGIAACRRFRQHFSKTNNDVDALEQIMKATDAMKNNPIVFKNSLPNEIYERSIDFMSCALIVIACAWVVIGVYAWFFPTVVTSAGYQ